MKNYKKFGSEYYFETSNQELFLKKRKSKHENPKQNSFFGCVNLTNIKREQQWDNRFIYNSKIKNKLSNKRRLSSCNKININNTNIRNKRAIYSSYEPNINQLIFNNSAKNFYYKKNITQNLSEEEIKTSTNNYMSYLKNCSNENMKLIYKIDKLWDELYVQQQYRLLFILLVNKLGQNIINDISIYELKELENVKNDINLLLSNIESRKKILQQLKILNYKLDEYSNPDERIVKYTSQKIINLRKCTIDICKSMKKLKCKRQSYKHSNKSYKK